MHCLKTLTALAVAGMASVAASPIASAAQEEIPTAAVAISKADPAVVSDLAFPITPTAVEKDPKATSAAGGVDPAVVSALLPFVFDFAEDPEAHTPSAPTATHVPAFDGAEAAALGGVMAGMMDVEDAVKSSASLSSRDAPASDGDSLIDENTAKVIDDWVKYLEDPEATEHAAAATTSSVDPLESLSVIPFKYYPKQDLPLLKTMLAAKQQWRDEEDTARSRLFSLAPRDAPAPIELPEARGARGGEPDTFKKALEFVKAEKADGLDMKTVKHALMLYMMQRRIQDALASSHLSKRDGDAPASPATTPAMTDPVPTTSPTTLPTTTAPNLADLNHADQHFLKHIMEIMMDKAEEIEATAAPPLVTLSPALASEISRLPAEAQVAVSSMLKHNSETAFYPSTLDPLPPWTTVTATFTDPSLNTPRSVTTYNPSASTFVKIPTKAPESGESDWPLTGYLPASAFYPVAETDSFTPEKLARDVAETSPATTPYATYIPASAFYPVAETDNYAPVVESSSTTEPFRTTIPPRAFYPAAETDDSALEKLARDVAHTSPMTSSYARYIPASSFYPVAETDTYAAEKLARDAAGPIPSTTPFRSTIPASAFYPYPPSTAAPDPLKLARDVEKTPAPSPTKFVTLTHDPKFDNPRATWVPAPDSYGAAKVARQDLARDDYVDEHDLAEMRNGWLTDGRVDEADPVGGLSETPAAGELETRGIKDVWKKFHKFVKIFPSPIRPMGVAKEKREDEE